MSQTTFQGSFVALVTPFRNGQVDEAKLRELVEFHVGHGTDGLIPCGTTGESPALSHDEHRRVVEVVVDAAHKRIPVTAGTGSNCTREAIGGVGVVSVIANIVPREVAEMVHAALDGDFKRARDLHFRLFPLARAAFLETNPIPIKEAMALAGMLEPEFRLPMCRMNDANREKLRTILKPYGLIK